MAKVLLFSLIVLCLHPIKSEPIKPFNEGMWLMLLNEQVDFSELKRMGLTLRPEQIYNADKKSLKDAIVMLGSGFCSGSVISPEGLVLTNHHCAYDAIQSLSSVEENYLKNGFWPADKEGELPIEGLTMSFLVRMENVTSRIVPDVANIEDEVERSKMVSQISKKIQQEAIKDTHYNASIKPFYEGNEYYLFVYETFTDIRLAGAPPEAIGLFGGDTDNWKWPRHTGDFSLLRIYADADGMPAEYSEENIPLKSKYYLPVSLAGIQKNDFTMTLGYPGSTNRFLTSEGIKVQQETALPERAKIREVRLNTMKNFMNKDETVELKYASKYAAISNYYLFFTKQIEGLKRQGIYEVKQGEEDKFKDWAKAHPARSKYYKAIRELNEAHQAFGETALEHSYFVEAVLGSEILQLAYDFAESSQSETLSSNTLKEAFKTAESNVKRHFKNYDLATDKAITKALLALYVANVPSESLPAIFGEIGKDNLTTHLDKLFQNSIFASEEKLRSFYENPTSEQLTNDLAVKLASECVAHYIKNVVPRRKQAETKIKTSKRLYIEGLRKMNVGKKFSPDANSTMRLSYGKVTDYSPQNGVLYSYYTTGEGILEKENPNNKEFIVPQKLINLLEEKDYGRYAKGNTLPVAFISDNDITGGNSGSPVINGEGYLVGLAFDLNGESAAGDIVFDTKMQRCINLDIRYILFLIDKFADASHLIDELDLKKGKSKKTEGFESLREVGY